VTWPLAKPAGQRSSLTLPALAPVISEAAGAYRGHW